MLYHIFEINPFKQLSFLEAQADYRAAKKRVSVLREAPGLVAGTTYRMMLATDQFAAERLLTEKREARPMGEHD